ncbi:hypothetical protein KIN20_003259 [Parelaphostrongylus tenuis]|uniref:Nodal modulator 1 n=1 Tax=Parelaphostrongylus tenuis TaxID=148309 RepID=A0AAD5LWG0_PARTN|nr:hypothetical protein KIN20_003259 [Parelaphostrongylus tenuis]
MNVLWFVLLLGHISADDIYSCGGFVKSSVPIDYSRIQVKLLTPEGHLKHEEECNPQNGYYMIPVYSKGQYSLKVFAPKGWYFEPEVVDFNLDGLNDPCTQNRDINFVLTGFSIHGVVDGGSGSGPTGLSLILKQDGKVVDTTTTTEGGKYSFKAVAGKYEVSTGADSSVCIKHGKTFVEVKNAPVLVKPDLRIVGYAFIVAVRNKDQPLPNAQITLYSERRLELDDCKAVTSPPHGVKNAAFICNVGVTKDDGIASVTCLPNGVYYVTAEYKTNEADFSFSPAVQKVVVENRAVKISFSVTGFTARGRVVVNNKGVSGAQVVVQGEEVTKTDANGYFTLQALKEGTLDITARAPHTKFSIERNTFKLPNIKIKDVNVEGFDVCGSVEISFHNAIVSPLVLKKTDGTEIVSIRPNADGKFCKMVAPGKYTISPADSSSTLTPRSLDIDVTTSYVDNLLFTHFKTDAVVLVTCIGTCEPLSISLLQNGKVLDIVRGKDEFVFKNIGPGTYRVRINEGDRACWENRELPLFIDKVRPQPVHFVQSGFTSTIKLSHPANLRWSHSEKKQLRGDVNAGAGLSLICVPVQGRYNVQLISCMNFDPPQFDITVTSDSIYEAKAVDAKISGLINGTDGKGFVVKVKSPSGERDVSVAASGIFSFYEPLTSIGDVIIKPHSATHLFEPPTFVVRFRGECEENVVKFVAIKGTFIDGSITPPISGVKITGQHRQDSNIKFSTVSDSKGKYRIGPLRRAEDIQITAELDGYSFAENPGHIGQILSTKLSKLTVVVSDMMTSQRLEGVLLSVVGERDYRSNNLIDETGVINFVGLAPGDYFLRAILQEYKFEPSMTTVTVKEGQHEHVELRGGRVSYSVFGRVREMSGAPLVGVIVEALSEKCDQHQSEATTTQDGVYRIRALKPQCQYRVSVKGTISGEAAPHCFPSKFDVKMTAEDLKGLDMVAAPYDFSTDLAVEIEFSSMAIPSTYRVSVQQDGEIISQSVVHAPVSVFYLNGLPRDGKEYSVRVEPDRHQQPFMAKTVFFTTNEPVHVVRVPITMSKRSSEVEISVGSLLALPFFGLIALAFFNQGRSKELLRSLVSVVHPPSPSIERKKRK